MHMNVIERCPSRTLDNGQCEQVIDELREKNQRRQLHFAYLRRFFYMLTQLCMTNWNR